MAHAEIHISDVRSFKSCRRKWNWSSPLRENLEKRITYMPFFTGKAIHYGLQQLYEYGEHPAEAAMAHMHKETEALGNLWDVEQDALNEQSELVLNMMNHYVQWRRIYHGEYEDANIRFIALETEFNIPLYNPKGRRSTKVRLAGRFDGIVEHIPTQTFWIWENKTARSIEDFQDSLINDEQAGAYIIAAQEMFKIPIQGVLYNLMRKKVPTQPQVLKNGQLSQRADMDTTFEIYLDAIKRNHPGWDEAAIKETYGSFLQMLLLKGNTYFKRLAIYRTPFELENLQLDLWRVALEMTNPGVALYPTPDWMSFVGCRKCAFKAPCMALNNGADVMYILSEEYQKRRSWDSLNADSEDTTKPVGG